MYLIPKPYETIKKEGSFCITYQTRIIVTGLSGEASVRHAFLLQKELEKRLGYRLNVTRGEKTERCIFLEINSEEGACWNRKEGYRIEVKKDGIRLTGADEAGLLYAVQTLLQITDQEGAVLGGIEIRDFPSLSNRGFYHDVTRGRIPTLAYMKKLADRMAYYKMNQLQLYIEHSFLFQHFSEMWRDDTPITPEEILELDAYCRNLHIELLPSVSTFGHLYKLLGTKTWNHLCELPGWQGKEFSFNDRMAHHTIDVSNPESLRLVKKMIREFMPLFTSKQFNICADETFDLGKGKSRPLADEIGVKNMYVKYVKELCDYVIENGKRPMFWGDVICGFPEAIKELPEETICLNWGYAAFQNEDSSKALQEAGATQYSCPGVCGWDEFMNLIESSYENITRMVSYAQKYASIGVLNTDWGDYGHINHPDFSIPGLIYGAAFSWNPETIPFGEINRQISRVEYGDASEQIVSVMASMEENTSFGWRSAVRFMEETRDGAPKEERKELYLKIREEELLNQRALAEKGSKAEHTDGVEGCTQADGTCIKPDKECMQEKNRRMEQVIDALYGIIPSMNPEKRDRIKPCVIAAEGIMIFNRIGEVVGRMEFGLEEDLCGNQIWDGETDYVSRAALAEELEHWFYHYKQIWRTVSRESELFRIQNVINWYGDYLRTER